MIIENHLTIYSPLIMPLLLRMHHEKKDVIFQVLTDKPSSQSKLEVFLCGKTYIFTKLGNRWIIDLNQNIDLLETDLIKAVAKALALRFRISSSQLAHLF